MPQKRVGERADRGSKRPNPVDAQEKIARLLGLLVTREMPQRTDQVVLLRSVGFEVAEVAEMLGMTQNHVKVADHLGRKNRGKRKSRGRSSQD